MSVAYCEIVEAALLSRIARDREIRLVAVKVERASVNAADAHSCITSFARWKRHGQVALACLRPARARIKDNIGRQFIGKVVSINDVDPARKTRSKRVGRRP